MRIIGVDPGLVTTGYGVIEEERGQVRLLEGGIFESGPSDQPVENRLLALQRCFPRADVLRREVFPNGKRCPRGDVSQRITDAKTDNGCG